MKICKGFEILPGIFPTHYQLLAISSIAPPHDLAHHFLTTSNIIYVFYYVEHYAEHCAGACVDDSQITIWRWLLGPRP